MPAQAVHAVGRSATGFLDFYEEPPGDRDLSELERDVSAVTDDLRADFDQLFGICCIGGKGRAT